jgi:hypothetical protein
MLGVSAGEDEGTDREDGDGGADWERPAESDTLSSAQTPYHGLYTGCPKTYVTNFSWLFPTPN